MSLLIVKVLLWIGFGLILWAMRESLVQLESDLHLRAGRPSSANPLHDPPLQVQRLLNPIGRYRDVIIHEYALIDGRPFRFAYVCPTMTAGGLAADECWLAPGLVYIECNSARALARIPES